MLVGVGGKVKALQTQLKQIKCLLRDADRRHHKCETVRNWLSQIRDLSYRTEGVILEYAVRISADGRRRGFKLFLLRLCFSLHRLGSEISYIRSELASLSGDMNAYGISRIIDGDGKPSPISKLKIALLGRRMT